MSITLEREPDVETSLPFYASAEPGWKAKLKAGQ